MWITRVSINNPVFATMVMVALCVLGLFSYNQLGVERTPDVTPPIVFISVAYPGASAEAATELKRWYPSLKITGTHHGYFEQGSPHEQRVLEHINEHQPDILLVGMGTPQQEVWVERHFDEVDAKVVWTVGALFEYVSGRIKRAPHWMSDNGLEWIFRLAVEPRRMWRRYLLGNPAFLYRVLEERRAHSRR